MDAFKTSIHQKFISHSSGTTQNSTQLKINYLLLYVSLWALIDDYKYYFRAKVIKIRWKWIDIYFEWLICFLTRNITKYITSMWQLAPNLAAVLKVWNYSYARNAILSTPHGGLPLIRNCLLASDNFFFFNSKIAYLPLTNISRTYQLSPPIREPDPD